MNRYLSIAIFFLLLPCLAALAQDYTVELQPDKKVIYVAQLGLAENTPLLEVLYLIPELVVREGNEFLSGYDVLLDSKSVSFNKDVLLSTMKLYEVEKIEISTSATASQQRNGMAGEIKIVSRSMSEGFSGSVSTNLNTLWTAYPNLNLNYRTDKLELRGNLGLQYYSGGTSNYFGQDTPPTFEVGEENNRERYFQETARLYLKYNFSEKDQLKLWVLESHGLDNKDSFVKSIFSEERPQYGEFIYRVTESADTNYNKSSKLNFSAFAEYEHIFRDEMKFTLSADYIGDRNKSGTETLEGAPLEAPKVIRSEGKFVLPFLPAGDRSLNMTVGGNLEYDINDRAKIESRSYYASPLLELKYNSDQWKVNSGVRYQYYNFTYEKSRRGLLLGGNKDLTFNVNTLWQMAEHHALRFFVTKNIMRPSSDQMYPVIEWDFRRKSYVRGNEDLQPSSMYSFELNYITDWNLRNHNFILNLSFGYDRADGLVTMIQKYDTERRKFYLTYANSGVNDIFNAKFDFLYRYGIFAVSFAGNWYHNVTNNNGNRDNIDNFNIAASPVFSFHNNWTLTGTFRFNNAVIRNDSRIGECLYSNIRLSKSFGKWVVNAALSDIFGYQSENFEYRDGGLYYSVYDQYPRCIEVGVTYRIGY